MKPLCPFLTRFALLLTATVLALATPPAPAAPAAPGLHTFTQPDGTAFRARLIGDEFFNWYQTADGHPIVYDEATKLWTYALPGDEGVSESSGVPVSDGPSPGIAWRPKAPKAELEARKTRKYKASVPTVRRSQARDQGNGAVTANIAMLLTKYSDRASWTTKNGSEYETLFFDTSDPAAFTMANLYKQMSYGQHIPTSGPAGIQDWATAPSTHDYYGGGAQVSGSTRETGTRVGELVLWRVTNADASMDFGPYDTDNDGFVDLVCVVFQGTDQAGGGSVEDIWPIRWTLADSGAGNYTTNDKNAENETVKVRDFIVIPELSVSPPGTVAPITTIGLLCHEYGHGIGWPDLYDPPGSDSASQGLGDFCLMAGGNWNNAPGGTQGDRPCWANAYLRMQSGWVAPEVLTTNRQDYRINDAKRENQVIRLTKDGSDLSEFYLLERRQQNGFDVGMPGNGLFIWHVDTTVNSNNNQWWFISNSDLRTSGGHYRVALEQADGRFDLEKNNGQGDANDPFQPGGTFSDTSVPSSRNYANQATNVAVRNIRSDGDDYIADLYVKADNIFPEVQFTNPADGGTYVSVPSLIGTASDNAGVASVKAALRRNGGGSSGEEWYDWTVDNWSSEPYDAARYEKTAGGTTSWFVNVVTGRITPGSYTFFAQSWDTSGGGSGWKFIWFSVVDNPNGPDIRYSSPAAHTNLNSASPGSFTGTVVNYSGDATKKFVLERISETPGGAGSYFNWSNNTFGEPGEFGAQHQTDQSNNLNTWTVSLAGRGLTRGRYAMWAKLYTADLRESPWQQRFFRIDYPPLVAIQSPANNASLINLGPVTGTCLEPTGAGAQGGGVRLTFTDGIGRYWTGTNWSSSQFILTAPISNGTWSFDAVPADANLGSGVFYISASLTTTTGESAAPGPENQISFRIDRGPPSATITSPLANTTITTSTLPAFTGTATDPGGVSYVNAYIRRESDQAYWSGYGWSYDNSEADDGAGQPAPTVVVLPTTYNAGTGAWSCTANMPRPGMDLLSGNYTWIIIAGDRAGNYLQVDAPVVVDYHATFVWHGTYSQAWELSWNWRDETNNFVPRSPGQHDIAVIPAGTVDAPGNRTLHSLRLTGGTINVSGVPAQPTVITSLTPSIWSAGTINGALQIPAGMQLDINPGGTRTLATSSLLVNHGTVTQNATAPVTGYNTVRVENKFDGVWRFTGAGDPFDNVYGGNVFKNDGLAEKTGAGILTFNDWTFDMPGETRSSSIIEFNSDAFFLTGALFSGTGTVRWNGPMDLQGTLTQNAAFFEMTGGTVTCSGSAAIAGTWEWKGGAIQNTMNVPSGSTLKILSGADHMLNTTSVLVNRGTVQWTGPGGITGYNTSRITNEAGARFEALNGGDVFNNVYGGNVFQNDGLFVKTGGAAALVLNDWTFTNPGELKTDSGALETSLELNLPAGAKLSGTGTQKWLASTVDLTGTIILTCPLELDGATLITTGPGILNNDWTWKSGTVDGQLHILAGKRLTVTGAGGKTLATSAVITNFGTMKWEGPAPIIGYNTITWHNRAGSRIELNADGDPFDIVYGDSVLVNESTIAKTGGTGVTTVNDWVLTNKDEIRADTGGLDFSSEVHWLAGTRLRGPGTIRQRAHTFLDGPTTMEAPVIFYEGELTAAPAASITGALEWRSGTLDGTCRILSGSTLRLVTGAKTLATNSIIQNSGLVDWQSGDLTSYNTGLIDNLTGSTFRTSSNGTFGIVYGGDKLRVASGAQMLKTAATTSHIDWAVDNNGTCDVQGGTLSMEEGGAGSGAFTSTAGTTLVFAAGDFTLKNGASVLGAGTNQVTGAGVYAEAAATGRFSLQGGTLGSTGAGVLTLTGANQWTQGNLEGATTVAAGATLTISTAAGKQMNTSSVLTNQGTVEFQTGVQVIGYNSVTLENTAGGIVRLAGDITPFTIVYGGNVFRNRGTLQKTSGSGTATLNNWSLDHFGTCGAATGILELSLAATFQPGAHINGPGRTRFSSGSLSVQGTTTIDSGAFESAGGTLAGHTDGTARLTAAGGAAIEWTGGNVEGTVTFAGNSAISGAATKQINTSAILKNAGVMNVSGGSVLGYNASTLRNLAGATLRIVPGMTFTEVYGGNVLGNDGTLELTGTGTLTSPWAFSQSATGTLRVPIAAAGPGLASGVLQSSAATLGGNFVAVIPGGLVPPADAEFFPLTYNSYSGAFASVLTSGGGAWEATYEANRVKIKVNAVTPLTFDQWAVSKGLTGANALSGADPDKDGQTNFAEYVFNSNPTTGSPAPQATGMVFINGQQWLTVNYRRWADREAAGVVYAPQSGGSLGGWSSTGIIDEADPNAPVIPGSTACRCRVLIAGPIQFLRVKATKL